MIRSLQRRFRPFASRRRAHVLPSSWCRPPHREANLWRLAGSLCIGRFDNLWEALELQNCPSCNCFRYIMIMIPYWFFKRTTNKRNHIRTFQRNHRQLVRKDFNSLLAVLVLRAPWTIGLPPPVCPPSPLHQEEHCTSPKLNMNIQN